jgi:hypothetical protein
MKLWGLSLLVLATGCALDVQPIRYPESADLAPRPDGCDVRVLEWHRGPEGECREVGDVYVGDRGLAFFSGCRKELVVDEIRAQACRLGADTALVRRVKDFGTSCYEARARLLRCNADSETQS